MPDTQPLTGKVAIVTGGPRSIGREAALELARNGASVVVHYRSRKDEAEETVTAVRAFGGEADAVPGDLTASEAVRDLFAQTMARFGGIDIVVANAGVTTPVTPVADITDDTYQKTIAVNTTATFYVLREAARTIRDGGRIINISSSSAHFRLAGFTAYASSKAAALITTGILAIELGPRGVTANSLILGPIDSGFLDPSSPAVAAAPPGMLDSIAAAAPMRRLGTPTDIAPVIAFLAGPDSGWVNGQDILINNGGPV